jgi:hypothetical protein
VNQGPETLVVREPFRTLGLWVRIALLVVLIWGAFVTALSLYPQDGPIQNFRNSLRTGNVAYVIYETDGQHLQDLRWSSGPLFWYQVDFWHETERSDVDYEKADLIKELKAASAHPVVRQASHSSNGQGLFPDWPFQVPVPHLSWLVKLAWIAAFVFMLGTARPRLGNRWAWFWLFTVGQVGAIAFLMSEPRAVWRGIEAQPPTSSRMGGGQGCVVAIGLGVISALVAGGIAWAVNLVLGS